jgi:hypothetical protein
MEIFFEAIDRSLVELRRDFKEAGLFRIQKSGFRIQEPGVRSREPGAFGAGRGGSGV